ncbi:unnamed protein product, partial [Nesidiocoris tenuis]
MKSNRVKILCIKIWKYRVLSTHHCLCFRTLVLRWSKQKLEADQPRSQWPTLVLVLLSRSARRSTGSQTLSSVRTSLLILRNRPTSPRQSSS